MNLEAGRLDLRIPRCSTPSLPSAGRSSRGQPDLVDVVDGERYPCFSQLIIQLMPNLSVQDPK